MVAGELLHGESEFPAAHSIEKHRGAERSIRACILVVEREEGGEAVGGGMFNRWMKYAQVVAQWGAEPDLIVITG